MYLFTKNKNKNMNAPKFLLADNSAFPDDIYVLHTESPRFLLNVDTESYLILDGTELTEEAMAEWIQTAVDFYEEELNKYEEDNDF
jgi:hypothetical protein